MVVDAEADRTMPKLTACQAEILSWIICYRNLHGYPPTVREIGRAFDIRSNNGVADHLAALKAKGRIAWSGGKARTLRVLQES